MTIKTWQERMMERMIMEPTDKQAGQSMQAEIDELRAELAKECRHIKQAEGKHPAPCARFCESTAYEIELRQMKAENSKLRAALDAWEKQKPAAWLHKGGHVQVSSEYLSKRHADEYSSHKDWVCLYTKPKEVT